MAVSTGFGHSGEPIAGSTAPFTLAVVSMAAATPIDRPRPEHRVDPSEYQRIEAEIASDDSPVGIDAKKTHVMILAKLESIERRLDSIERQGVGGTSPVPGVSSDDLLATAAVAGDAFDDEVSRLASRGIDVDARAKAAIGLLEKATDERVLSAVGEIVARVDALEQAAELVAEGPNLAAMVADILDDEVRRAMGDGICVDTCLRNGLHAMLFLGQRISETELEALGELLRSDLLHPKAIDVLGRMTCSIVSATEEPTGSVGPFGALKRLGNPDARRATAFLLEFLRLFGAALDGRGRRCTDPISGTCKA